MFVRVKFTKSTFHQADANTRVPCVCVRESGVWVWRSVTPAGDCT